MEERLKMNLVINFHVLMSKVKICVEILQKKLIFSKILNVFKKSKRFKNLITSSYQ